MRNAPNIDAILAIDNNAYKYDFKNRIENKIDSDAFNISISGLSNRIDDIDGISVSTFNTAISGLSSRSVKCFFFDSKLNDEMNLLRINFYGEKDFGRVMWTNCDYRFYYVKKFFPNYKYYWQIEYDVFCNAPTYEGFLKKFKNNRADLLINEFRTTKKNSADWIWNQHIDWAYSDDKAIYRSLYPVVRLSARAVDFLYNQRLHYKKIYNPEDDKNRWQNCELFTATELMNNGFLCENLDEPNVRYQPNFYLNDDRFFLIPDNKLYHPVKSVQSEISKLQTQINDLNLSQRKLFLTSLVKLLNEITVVDIKSFPIYFNEQFTFAILSIPNGGGQRALLYGSMRGNLYRLTLRRKICQYRR